MAASSKKRTLWWNQDVKEAIRAKKHALKALLQNRSSSDLQSLYSEARKTVAQAVKMSKKRSWEKFGLRLDSNYSSGNKVFWQTIRRLRGKSFSTRPPPKIQLETSSRMRRKSFHDGENTFRFVEPSQGNTY